MANNELLQQVLTHIKDHPDEHDQNVWIQQTDCGTVACMAGWACLISGEIEGIMDPWSEFGISSRATRLLNISPSDADILFSPINTIDQLELMVKDLQNGDSLVDLWKTDGCHGWERRA